MALGSKYLQGCMFAFVVLTILSLTFEGLWMSSSEYSVFGQLASFSAEGFGGWAVVMVPLSFLRALPSMLSWDYAFFTSLGAAGMIIRILLMLTITVGFVWGFLMVLLPIAASVAASLIRGITGIFSRF